jgi:lipopolysaccharide/colanic/teichoic acid biosynthesis glycosyltransferase
MLGENTLMNEGRGRTEGGAEKCEGPRRRAYIALKAVMEWLAALVLTLMLAPIILVLAALTKLNSPGPAFYSQVRLGRYGRPYRIWKIRTMRNNCEAKSGAVWSTGPSDPRVTTLGRILRDTHLDELPQLWNVLRGDMALIGPRPERPEIASKIDAAIPRYRHRLIVRPGVTGLAQVQLPPDSDLESVRRKLAYDLHYVHEVSPLLDARILASTALMFLSDGIHAISAGLVKAEKRVVEKTMVENIQMTTGNGWRAGAA